MNINRNNYEEFFVLYIDNELTAPQRAVVDMFVAQNPDLKGELEMLQQTVLPQEEPLNFLNKEMLFRKEQNEPQQLVNPLNCEAFFVLYADNELKNDENALVEEFIYRHPEYQETFELIQQVKFTPDRSVVFPDKSLLYRSENDVKVVPMFRKMRFWKMAAAAAVVIMISGTAWFALQRNADNNISVLANNDQPAGNNPGNSSANGLPNSSSDSPANSSTNSPANSSTNSSSTSSTSPSSQLTSPETDGVNKEPSANPSGTAIENLHTPAVKQKTDSAPDNSSIASGDADADKKNKSVEGIIDNNRAPKVDIAQNNPVRNNGKKVTGESNILVPQRVEQEGAGSKAPQLKVPTVDEQKKLDEIMAANQTSRPDATSSVAIGPVALKEDNVFAKLANENDEEFEQSNKKNKMRGFFRKVTRVFDKATSREPSENRKGINIASFAIDLK